MNVRFPVDETPMNTRRARMSLSISELIDAVDSLIADALDLEEEYAPTIERVDGRVRSGARNLVHYMALRRHDLRELQPSLSALGLSSLGRSEADTLPMLEALRHTLRVLLGDHEAPGDVAAPALMGPEKIAAHADLLFGEPSFDRPARIMVTMPSEAADDPTVADRLVAAGMDVCRINAAHDDADAWRRMAAHVRAAQDRLGAEVKVMVDLSGPKLRTGSLPPGPRVRRVKPDRDARGRVRHPARALFTDQGVEEHPNATVVPVESSLVSGARIGDLIRLADARGRNRRWTVVAVDANGVIAECEHTTYFETGALLRRWRTEQESGHGRVASLPEVRSAITVEVGDTLILSAEPIRGRLERRNASGRLVEPAVVSVSVPEVLSAVQPGERVLFDDGKIVGRVEEASGREAKLSITRVRGESAKLRSEKGINLPDSRLPLPALTPEDLADLDLAVEIADIVGLSFVNRAEDVVALHRALEERCALGRVGTILKIETQSAFASLPAILLEALRVPPVGIMVARGDLAAEVGFERLAEVQEEILWLCEASHVPVVWATQVLETLAKTGVPSRGEVTDAAASVQAECVMLNKGPFILETIDFLSDVLGRMRAHHHKKRATLRALRVAGRRR